MLIYYIFFSNVFLGRTSRTTEYIFGREIPSALSCHVSEEQLSSLVYIKKKDNDDRLCGGVIISSTRTMFVSLCMLEKVIKCPENSEDYIAYTEHKLKQHSIVVGSLENSVNEYSIASMVNVDTDFDDTDPEEMKPYEILTVSNFVRDFNIL